MRYLSVCSGIEAATVAWHHMGWIPAAFSEIEPFPSAVLAHHYPTVPNVGDMTKYKEWDIGSIDLLVGGTPCQSFSVAGLRKGLADPRGNLALVYLGIADLFKPKWIVWENVPGVLSSAGGRDFGSFLGALAQLGYGFAYRVLDAQWFGVAQRRRRVFVVGYLGDWRPAAAVLFESQSLCRDTPKGREKRKTTAPSPSSSVDANGLQRTVGTLCADTHPGAYSGQDAYTGRLVPSIVGALDCRLGAQRAQNAQAGHMVPVSVPGVMCTLRAAGAGFDRVGNAATEHETYIPMVECIGGQHPNAAIDTERSPTLTNAMGAGGGHVPLINQPIPYDLHQVTAPVNRQAKSPGDPCHTLAKQNAHNAGIVQPIPLDSMAFGRDGDKDTRYGLGVGEPGQPSFTLTKAQSHAVAQPISIQGNLIGREAGGPQGVGASDEGVMYTLTKADVHGVAQPMAVHENQRSELTLNKTIGTISCSGGKPGQGYPAVMQPIGFDAYNNDVTGDVSKTIDTGQDYHHVPNLWQGMAVRRLTPVECERLQGFPDNYTEIFWRGKETPDGPRYKALGNSMAVPVMRWIGERINGSGAGK